MNTARKGIQYFMCTVCPDIYMKVNGYGSIGLAQFPRTPFFLNIRPSEQGPCPKHQRKLSEGNT